ncbi:MAG: tetratricopeptide repeat protein [Verrucomicrobiae bacterium]|nr:tetratricopeptide repeat protein [Verrucomicrobiae bacterium]
MERWLSITVAAAALVAMAAGSVFVSRWWPGQPGDYGAMIQQKLSRLPGGPGAEGMPMDAADQAIMRGNALLAQNRPAEAIAQFEQAVAQQPAHALAWVNLGVVYYGLGRTNEARQALLRGYQLDPFNFLAARNLGLMCERQGHLQAAHDFYLQASRLDPSNAEIIQRLERLKARAKTGR